MRQRGKQTGLNTVWNNFSFSGPTSFITLSSCVVCEQVKSISAHVFANAYIRNLKKGHHGIYCNPSVYFE